MYTLGDKTFTVGDAVVRLKVSRGKNLRLRIDGRTAEVTAYYPRGYPIKKAEIFVISRREWIEGARKKVLERIAAATPPEGCVRLFGEDVFVEKIEGNRSFFSGGTIFLAAKDDEKTALDKFLRKVLSDYLAESVAEYSEKTGLKPAVWRIRKMRGRWGSCNHATGSITFNAYLVRFKRECIDYIVLHELAHLKYPNHQKEFKEYISAFMPDWKIRKKLLNGGGII